eukprot:TRINITY_DN11492_c4_g1_i3.p2 TRINITY_DN11492_c4_g1~~TRINITY_DN11492_c4_g1_i3.p2  ORF type:complete len:117 (+),score=20.06 TRINITY_DN11492_c4_g1_i3:975-1325(+)
MSLVHYADCLPVMPANPMSCKHRVSHKTWHCTEVALSPSSHIQRSSTCRALQISQLEELPEVKAILDAFQSKEIVPWQQFEAQHGELLQSTGALEMEVVSVYACMRVYGGRQVENE